MRAQSWIRGKDEERMVVLTFFVLFEIFNQKKYSCITCVLKNSTSQSQLGTFQILRGSWEAVESLMN